MSTAFKPLQIPPGVVAMPTKNMSSSNWAEVNLMRWIEGEMQPVGGQSQYLFYDINGNPVPGFASRCKAIHGWYDLQDVYHIAYVCEQNVYIYTAASQDSGILAEVTPIGGWPALPLPTQGGYGDLGYGEDNYGTPRASSTILPVDQLPNVWSVDNFGAILLVQYSADGRLLMLDPAQGTSGVAATEAAYSAWGTTDTAIQMVNMNPGTVFPGMRVYNQTQGNYVGTVAQWNTPLVMLTAAAANPGNANDVLAFGNVLTEVQSSQAAPYNQVPLGRGFVVTSQRFVLMYGTTRDGTVGGGSARRFGWCDQGDFTNWNYSSVTNQAGYLDIEPSSPIVTACNGRFGVLLFTAKKAYIVTYLGLPYIYDYVELADNCTPWSPLSITPTASYMLWFSDQGVFSFDGTVIAPVSCLVRKWITDSIDPINVREQSFAFHNSEFSEFWWFFPIAANPPYNSRCVIYNYKEGWWAQGIMARSAGVTSSYTVQPVLANGTIAFQHELGTIYSADTIPPYAETFDLNVAAGTRLTTLKQIIPDINGDWENIQFQFWSSISRSIGPTSFGSWSPPVPIRPDGYVDVRQTGRDIRMKISVIGAPVTPWTMGQNLYDAVPRGDR